MTEQISYNPATGASLGAVPCTDEAGIDATVIAAEAAARDWEADATTRGTLMHVWADALAERADELAELLTSETGKVRREADLEVRMSIDALRFNAGLARVLDGESGPLPDGSIAYVERVSTGVAAFIVPWNWPVLLLMRDLAPALAAGATAVIKPAPQTPLSVDLAVRIGHEAGIPLGVANVVFGDGDVGRALVRHPLVRTVAFTGSTNVGREVMRAAADDFTRVVLELGGKGFSLIFDDADVDAAVEACVANAFITSGQMCMANTRILAATSIYDDVVEAVVGRVRNLSAGPPTQPSATMGPLISTEHRERVQGYVDIAAKEGSLVAQGTLLDDGGDHYVAPAVVASAADIDSRFKSEEIFGPLVTVERFSGEGEAVASGNASPYGLAASVWTADLDRAWQVARQIEAGTVWINGYNKMHAEVPSGGMKQSGIGRTRGMEGLREFTESRHINWRVGRARSTSTGKDGIS